LSLSSAFLTATPNPASSVKLQAQSSDSCNRAEFGKGVLATAAGILTFSELEVQDVFAADVRSPSSASSGSRVNKDAASLLRYGLPIKCPAVRNLQQAIENVKLDILIKNWSRAASDAQGAASIAKSKKDEILKAVRADSKEHGAALLAEIVDGVLPLQKILGEDQGRGSVLERAKLDEAYKAQDVLANKVGDLEELMVPAGYSEKVEANIPSEFDDLPRLLGRATVEMVFEKPGKAKFDVEGELYNQAKLVMILDGYTAPVTCGCVIDLIEKGFYNKLPITRNDGFVVQVRRAAVCSLGDPNPNDESANHGYQDRIVPLEIAVSGDEFSTYSVTTEDDGRGYASTKLPFQAYGALGMARSEFEADSASSQVNPYPDLNPS
ncbi:unnamed protein product, partial [Chrysoparadoxa australica]